MDKCPFCGSTFGVLWNDYGKIYQYFQTFGGSIENREVVEVVDTRSMPIWCKCGECGKRLKIKDVEKEI